VVDNEIYRHRPSVLVGTVDKLAVLGFQKLFSHLISSTAMSCSQHGYVSFGSCTVPDCNVKPRDYARLPPEEDPAPSLLIQDELHLLKEELGTFNAHYEGFLGRIPRKMGHRPPKVLAATATIENYENQAFHLYLKHANRFPVPSWQEGESFFATSTPREYRRLYAGVLTHHRNAEDATLKMLAVYHDTVEWMKANPNEAITELGLPEQTPEEEFLSFLRFHDLSLVYVNRKSTGGNIQYRLDEVVSPLLPRPLNAQLLTGDNSMADVREVIEQVEREKDESQPDPHEKPRLDSIIATSLISHGVDLERLNFMSIVGMPPRMAEYIQASSRAARSHAGLIMVAFRRQRVRERSQYHYFLPNHRHLDRLVEPVPINRFSSFATKRTIPGLLSGLLLNYYSQQLYGLGKIKRALMDVRSLQEAISQGHISKDEVLNEVRAIIGVDDDRIPEIQQRFLDEGVREAVEENWMRIQRSLDKNLTEALSPLLSFRDVDETIDFVAEDAASMFVERVH